MLYCIKKLGVLKNGSYEYNNIRIVLTLAMQIYTGTLGQAFMSCAQKRCKGFENIYCQQIFLQQNVKTSNYLNCQHLWHFQIKRNNFIVIIYLFIVLLFA